MIGANIRNKCICAIVFVIKKLLLLLANTFLEVNSYKIIMATVCVVTIDTRRFFDECLYSHLPIMHKVFGVYTDMNKAQSDVWEYFSERFKDVYEYCPDNFDKDGEALVYDDVFTHTDKEYGGIAYYGIKYHIENIE